MKSAAQRLEALQPAQDKSASAVSALDQYPGLEAMAEIFMLGEASLPFAATVDQLGKARRSHEALLCFLEKHPERRIYGIHTYYGADIADPRDPGDWRRQQEELLGYLHVGVGMPLPERVVRRALRLQARKALQGYSAIHPATLEALIALSNGAVLPAVPCYGSLGASGDLVPMAHAIAPVIRSFGARGPRDVLGLVNTNAMMSALAAELFAEALELFDAAIRVTAMVSLALGLDEEFCTGATLTINPAHHRNREAGAMIARAAAISRGAASQSAGPPPRQLAAAAIFRALHPSGVRQRLEPAALRS